MQEFDWAEAETHHSREMHRFLLASHDKPLTEDEFVAGYMEIPKISKAGNRVVRHEKSGRQQYNRLKERFGFFGGVK